MAILRPFCGVRPIQALASRMAALPYDVYDKKEAKAVVNKEPLSFLAIDRPETQFPDDYDMYAPEVYKKARQLYEERKAEGLYIKEDTPCYYLYELIRNGKSQTGVVGCASVDDYEDHVILRHEATRKEKEQDRIHHILALSAQTGPIFLAYRSHPTLTAIVREEKMRCPLFDFTTESGVIHRVWKIAEESTIQEIANQFSQISHLYIADGHHRAASAVSVGLLKRGESKGHSHILASDFFLCVAFPQEELTILPYYRVIKDLNNLSETEFLRRLEKKFDIVKEVCVVTPSQKGTFGLFLKSGWYRLSFREQIVRESDPVKRLDVSILQDQVLGPILGITDPRVDKRIVFIGGIHGAEELERRVQKDCAAAFTLFPTAIEELMETADRRCLMPPKSTWFEPKLLSGLFIHEI